MRFVTALALLLFSLLSFAVHAQSPAKGKTSEKKETDAEFSQRVKDFNSWLNDPDRIFMDDLKGVAIGKQTWATQNLNVDKFRSGDAIPQAQTKEEWVKAGQDKKPAWCYYNNDPANGVKYGRLYNWYAVSDPRGLAPPGWHIPTEGEWSTLTLELGGDSKAGAKMRSTSGWKDEGNGSNESSFDARPGSSRDNYATFYEEGKTAYWWSSTPFITGSAGYGYQLGTYGVLGKNIYDGNGLSVRCVKD
jgi:uncharacterized protein (TIGR02145 family)